MLTTGEVTDTGPSGRAGDRDVTAAGGLGRQATPSPARLRDRYGLEVLTRQECMDLLRGGGLGRIGAEVDGRPVILPVAYGLLGTDIVFRTGIGSRLSLATSVGVVAFEADAYDQSTGRGWSVSITGRSSLLLVAEAGPAVADVPLIGPPTLRDAPHVVRIAADIVTGRRIVADRRG